MRSGREDGEVVEYRTPVDAGNPDGGWVEFYYTKEGILVDRPRGEAYGSVSPGTQETRMMELTAPANPLAEMLGRLLPLAEKWLEKQVGQVEEVVAEPKRMLTPKEASVELSLHVQTVMAWCREGKLEAVKIGGNEVNGKGGKYLIPREAIDAYLAQQRLVHGNRRRGAK